MPGSRTFSGIAQKITEFEVNGREVVQPFTWYTCPTGKKAIVSGRIQCTSRGAAAIATLTIAGVIMFQWNNAIAPIGDYLEVPRALTTANGGQFALFDGIELSAGDTVVTSQDAGANAEFNLWAKIQETPV